MKLGILLSGVPCTGKTKFLEALLTQVPVKHAVVSIDKVAQRLAEEKKITYNELFTQFRDEIHAAMHEEHTKRQEDDLVIVERAHVTEDERRGTYASYPAGYGRLWIVVHTTIKDAGA